MAFQLTIRPDLGLIHLRLWGAIDLGDLGEIRHTIFTDPRFEPGFDVLVDATALETQALTVEETFKTTTASARAGLTLGRLAIVARTAPQLEFARVFYAVRDLRGEPGSVFVTHDHDEALTWLERGGGPSRFDKPT
jgi:hypothetical protein